MDSYYPYLLRAREQGRAQCPAGPTNSTTQVIFQRPEKLRCRKKFKFFIASVQRSGTHWIRETLQLHPEFDMSAELFKNTQVAQYREFFGLSKSNFSSIQIQSVILERVYGVKLWGENGPTGPNDIYEKQGFIFQGGQMEQFPKVVEMLHDSGNWKAIHLVRDIMDVFLSEEVKPAPGNRSETVMLDIPVSLRRLEATLHHQQYVKEVLNQFPHITITYEKLMNRTEDFCSVWKFVGCDCVPEETLNNWLGLSPHKKKHYEVIQNYDEFHDALQGTPFFDSLHKRPIE